MRSFLARIPQSVTAAALAAIATAAIIGGYTATYASHESNSVHACVSNYGGAVRIVSSDLECDRKTETSVEWNKEGPMGKQGPQGDPGPQGSVGALEDMSGIPCVVAGATGAIAVNVAANGSVSWTCIGPPADNDGDTYTVAGGDCDDNNPNINPGAPEVENGIDDDCDGVADDGLVVQLVVTPPTFWYQPGTGIGFMVINEGGRTATGLNWYLDANFSGFFQIDGTTCSSTLAPGAMCHIAVSYHPAPGQQEDGELMVFADNVVPLSVILHGQ